MTGQKIKNKDFMEIDIDFVKNYLRVDYDDDDILIETMMVAAESYIVDYLDLEIETIVEEFGEVPKPIVIAYLSIISHWYDRREVQSQTNTEKELSYIFHGILGVYRKWL